MKEMSPSNEIVVNCNDGGKKFSQERPLNGHIETVHEEKNSFKCNVYDATFSQKGNLNCHFESQTLHDLNDFFPS